MAGLSFCACGILMRNYVASLQTAIKREIRGIIVYFPCEACQRIIFIVRYYITKYREDANLGATFFSNAK